MIYGQASLDKGIGQLTSHKLRNILSKENFGEEMLQLHFAFYNFKDYSKTTKLQKKSYFILSRTNGLYLDLPCRHSLRTILKSMFILMVFFV